METKDLKQFLERVTTWPKAAQEEALHSLRVIEEDFVIDAGVARALARADAEMRRGDGVPQEEVFERSGV